MVNEARLRVIELRLVTLYVERMAIVPADTETGDNQTMQPSGEVWRFEVVDFPSPR